MNESLEQTDLVASTADKTSEQPRLLKLWRRLIIAMWIWAVYHLIRDTLQDVVHIHHPLIDIGHYDLTDTVELPWYARWLDFGGYRRWTSFPVEIFLILAIPWVWKRHEMTSLDWIIIGLFTVAAIIWIAAIPFAASWA